MQRRTERVAVVQSAEQRAAEARPVIEVRSIDYVPPAERHGKVSAEQEAITRSRELLVGAA